METRAPVQTRAPMQTVLVLRAHASEFPQPIAFEAGARLRVGARYVPDPDEVGEQEWTDWVFCRLDGPGEPRGASAAGGWVPLQILELIDADTAIAREAYTARELDVRAGERVIATRSLNGWAWCERADGASGWVPWRNLQRVGDG